eukprot:4379891-Pleurochrysis_carterae.AAC.1
MVNGAMGRSWMNASDPHGDGRTLRRPQAKEARCSPSQLRSNQYDPQVWRGAAHAMRLAFALQPLLACRELASWMSRLWSSVTASSLCCLPSPSPKGSRCVSAGRAAAAASCRCTH